MSELPELAVFGHDNLPGHPANVHIKHPDHEVEWPDFAGVRAMPMEGRFAIRHADGSLTTHEDGFLVVGPAGHPEWVSDPRGGL